MNAVKNETKNSNVEKYERAKKLVDKGERVGVAIKSVGLSHAVWGYYNSKVPKRLAKGQLVTLPEQKNSTGKVMMLVGAPEEISKVMKEFL